MMNAVDVQITMVSTNTPRDCTKPCFTGCDTVAVAAAFGALPMPASFENRPRLTPFSMAAAMPPTNPPASSSIPKAPPMIILKTSPIWLMFKITITRASTTYSSAIAGNTISATLATRRTPPNSTGAVSTIRTTPVHSVGISREAPRTSLMALACTMLNATPKVKISSTANSTPPARECSPAGCRRPGRRGTTRPRSGP